MVKSHDFPYHVLCSRSCMMHIVLKFEFFRVDRAALCEYNELIKDTFVTDHASRVSVGSIYPDHFSRDMRHTYLEDQRQPAYVFHLLVVMARLSVFLFRGVGCLARRAPIF